MNELLIDIQIPDIDETYRPIKDFEFIYNESISEYNREHYITESSSKTLSEKFRDVIAAIVESIRSSIRQVKNAIAEKSRQKYYKEKIKSDIDHIKRMKMLGIQYVEVIDMKNYRNTYRKLNSELHGYVHKFMKIKYQNTYQIDEDLNKFQKVIEKYEDQIEDASKKKIRIKVDDAIKLRSNELTGKTKYVDDLLEEMKKFTEYQEATNSFKTLYGIKGVDIIPRHQFFIIKIIKAISRCIRKAIVKAITTMAFVLA